jgi:ribonuclease BN (tRNA processing enzyme)
MALTVTVLGCSGTYAAAGNACSGYLVRDDGFNLLVDAGPGTLANLQRHIELTDLDAVVVTHSHPDHWLELPVLVNALRYIHLKDGLVLHSTGETLGLLETLVHRGMAPTLRPAVITDGSTFRLGPVGLRCSRTDHPPETLALRMTSGDRTLAYSADTGPDWSLEEFGPGIDLALCEATFLEREGVEEPVHLTGAQAGHMARASGAGRLLVTHLLPTGSVDEAVAEASDAYGAPVEAAAVHRTYDV